MFLLLGGFIEIDTVNKMLNEILPHKSNLFFPFETTPALKVILAKKHSPNINNNKNILQFRSLK